MDATMLRFFTRREQQMCSADAMQAAQSPQLSGAAIRPDRVFFG